METPEELISWLNAQMSDKKNNATSISDLRDGKEICLYLSSITNPDYSSRISQGKSQYDFAQNFSLAKKLFGLLGHDFEFKIPQLTKGDENELFQLLSALPSLKESEEITLDNLLDELENDLTKKLVAMKEFKREIDNVAAERDFYYNKLIRIEEASHGYKPASVEPVTQYLELSPTDFRKDEKMDE